MEIRKTYEKKTDSFCLLVDGRLKEALKLANKTQFELAEELNVAKTTVSRWVKGHGKKGVPLSMLNQIADLLKIDVEYLYNVEYSSPCLSTLSAWEKEMQLKDKYQPLLDYLRHSGHLNMYQKDGECMVVNSPIGWKYTFDEKALEKLDAKMQAHIYYELINNCNTSENIFKKYE